MQRSLFRNKESTLLRLFRTATTTTTNTCTHQPTIAPFIRSSPLSRATAHHHAHRTHIHQSYHTQHTRLLKRNKTSKNSMTDQERDAIRVRHTIRDMESIEKHMDLLIGDQKYEEALLFLKSEIDKRANVLLKKSAGGGSAAMDVEGNEFHALVISYLLIHLGKFHESFTMDLDLAEEAYMKALSLSSGSSNPSFISYLHPDAIVGEESVATPGATGSTVATEPSSSKSSERMQKQQNSLILFSLANLLYKKLNAFDNELYAANAQLDELLMLDQHSSSKSDSERMKVAIKEMEEELLMKRAKWNKMYDRCVSLLRKCIEIEPDMSEMKHKLAKVLLEYGEGIDEPEAESLLRQCIEHHYVPSFSVLAQYKVENNMREEGLALIDQAIAYQSQEKNPDTMDEEYVSPLNHYRLKLSYLKMVDDMQKIEQLCQYLIQNFMPDDLSIHIDLAAARERLKKYDEAIKDLATIYNKIKGTRDLQAKEEKVTSHHLIQFMLARMYDHVDQPQKSEALLRDLLDRLPHEEFYISLARYMARQNKKEEARVMLDEAITKHPDFNQAIRQFYPNIESVVPVVSNPNQ